MLFWLGLTVLVAYSVIGLDTIRGNRQLRFLRDIPPVKDGAAPRVSIIVPARNEGRHIRSALQSLLALDYPDYELILVNDRSEDATGAILEDMAAIHPHLKIVEITELPSGWLGKNHALWVGSQQASGELLLFTDADVVMEPSTLGRAVSYVQAEQLDHLASTPEARMPTLLLNMFAVAFGLFFGMFTRPWKARDPKSPFHIGIGAFNLVKASVYGRVGGHQAIALRPDDDLKLGKIIKKAGFRQDLAFGTGLMKVEWYASVRELIHGLEKNIFAGTDYRLWLALSGVVFHLISGIWPYLALFVTDGTTWFVYVCTVAVITLILVQGARLQGFSPWYALGFPLTAGLFCYIILRTLVCNLGKGGITWRGTFYPLDELRKNRV